MSGFSNIDNNTENSGEKVAMMIDKWGCRQIALALESYGIEDIVVSPGSRNAPLIASFNREGTFRLHSVIDERSAAFVALGIAKIRKKPVAVVCTSGTALLNFAPAVAEAYYSGIPLIVISANRPYEVINQMDGQTIVQPGALANIVKGTFNVEGDNQSEKRQWKNNVALNDALQLATSYPLGPVHIDVPLSAPLTSEIPPVCERFRKVAHYRPETRLDHLEARRWAKELADKRVLVIAGMCEPDGNLNRAINTLGKHNNIIVVAEPLANLHGDGFLVATPYVCSQLRSWAKDTNVSPPDIIIVFGGPIVNEDLKAAIHRFSDSELWYVGTTRNLTDTFKHLDRRIEYTPAGFFPYIAGALGHINRLRAKINVKPIDFKGEFNDRVKIDKFGLVSESFNAIDALTEILLRLPKGWNLQVSNGMAIRYLPLLPFADFHRIDCNRGVNGIDGSASTALGASIAYPSPTLFITGDMSMQYDIAALASSLVSRNLKIIVLSNGEGGIFRSVATTRNLFENDNYIACRVNLPLQSLAEAYGFNYLKIDRFSGCSEAADVLMQPEPVILEIKTSTIVDLEVFNVKSNH